MKSFMKVMHRGEKGFTLIELLIVIAILAIIAAVVIPNIAGFMISGKLAAANGELENVKTGELGFFGDFGYWPLNSTALSPVYVSGALTGNYTFDSAYGWALTGTGWAGLNWSAGVSGPTGHHGSWIRP
jgi:prepilin-type N-terminal cleavage/methylation domain-containing protein